ncbi:MAG TPA: immune inhibitor A [Nocardioides sp.]|uniref:immune inhibitor A domain-containing protein n=1 Tax=uncultured Nocardioides sp. TaxID=198441 RepID=UPI002635FDEC|nr:immune inhibitor A domain-containing protein [uncultured Nocardioides sp.]HRD61851.1 immune inhibitor A [Nocardioides sp.]HRI96194.1 immune inhibitor A [Nocardioides sp.]HRK46460.1 immune inhibitor A [Nocardioides sp.]
MSRKIAGLASLATVVATLGFAATAVPGAAQADPGLDGIPASKGPVAAQKPDNRPDALSRKQTALRQRAVDALVSGDAKTVGKGADRTIKLDGGVKVDYPATQTAQLLTFLLEFGDEDSNPAFPDNTAGPLHDEIPEPARSDNSTYWLQHFTQQHYKDMFFNGLASQNGESFKSIYNEMSSGRFDLEGDVSDWVKVPNAASYYQDADGEETGEAMTAFLQDGADAWYDDQVDAGKTPAEIKSYLASFDIWDRFDYDGDGDFNEPDGYIDHFQAIHAGEDESAGAPAWAIWAHRSSVNTNGDVGPAGNENGGVEIGDSGLWIRDYTTEPENGGLGVFAHEFAHDLGVPDYYDTQGGDNSTGFWTLMSQGSWNGHGDGAIGTTPNHMGAPDKLFLGWYGPNDLKTVDGSGAPQQVVLGPSYHATDVGAQALAVTLPQGSATIDVVEPDQGTHYFYSGNGDDRSATTTSPTVAVPAGNPELTARVSYSVEDDWDYAYLEVSADGGTTWDHVETDLSTTTDPNQQNEGFGITGCSGTRDGDGVCDNEWTDLSADLTAYAGSNVKVRFEMVNDAAYHELGFSVDSVAIDGSVLTDVEDGAPTWTLDGFRVMDGSTFTLVYDQYYLAENKTYDGYDKTLSQGPYSFDYPLTAPSKVDQYKYQDGLLVWYVNGLYADNDVSSHPGGGQALPVDANPEYAYWTTGGVPVAYASGNVNSFDATFDVDQTDGLHLTRENASGTRSFDVAAQPSVPVFEDTDPDGYWDDSDDITSWFSTQVAGNGTVIQVVSSDESRGQMVVRAGRKFVAVTKAAAVTGTPATGQTLTAVPPTFFQSGVAVSYRWQVAGQNVAGATGTTYQVKPGDAGKAIGVVVTGTLAGYDAATSTASASGTGQAAAVTLSVDAPKKVKAGHKAKIKVTVGSAAGIPEGIVKVTFGGKKVTGQLVNGTVKLKLPKLNKAGKKELVVTFEPTSGWAPATTTLKIRVTKKN